MMMAYGIFLVYLTQVPKIGGTSAMPNKNFVFSLALLSVCTIFAENYIEYEKYKTYLS